MAINLVKHKESLLAAWKDVLDEKSMTDWALFDYEGQTNDLKVIGKGDGGIEEMMEDLNSGKIMYAFLKVKDPKTSLPKCVLINWQGEGAPTVRKGTCANHIHDVAKLLTGAHVTLNARTEEEVDPQLIVDKVSRASGSAYSFGEPRGEQPHEAPPVGTAYHRVIPRQEINSRERDKFWENEEAEEKKRQDEERQRKDEERSKHETERKERELEEAALREARIRERTKSISQQREAERAADQRGLHGTISEGEAPEERESEEKERRNRTDMLRRQRSQEARALISKRTFDARAVFEQNSSAGQLHNPRRSSLNPRPVTAPVPTSPSALRKASLPAWPPSNRAIPITTPITAPITAPIIAGVPEKPAEVGSTELQQIPEKQPEPVPNSIVNTQEPENLATVEEDSKVEEQDWGTGAEGDDLLGYSNGDLLSDDLGLQARALYDYQAADSTEITFDPGDVITHIDRIDEGWWQGLGPDGTFGLFPANYVELIN